MIPIGLLVVLVLRMLLDQAIIRPGPSGMEVTPQWVEAVAQVGEAVAAGSSTEVVLAPGLGGCLYDLKAGFIEAMKQMEIVGLPCIVRPAFTQLSHPSRRRVSNLHARGEVPAIDHQNLSRDRTPGWSEQDPRDWWESVRSACAELKAAGGGLTA